MVSRPRADGGRLDARNPVPATARFGSRLGAGRRRSARSGLETAYCAETVAITYEEMGLLTTDKDSNWFDPGKFWSGDELPLAPGYQLGEEISVVVD